jgi:thiamine pyrophosphate-dependent acetolactate synthase large subunit-like protein
MTLALKHATLKRDVAHLIFPDEVQTLPASKRAKSSGPEGRVTSMEITPPAASLEKAISRLQAARRPLIIVGHGARFHMDKIEKLAEGLRCPVITTFKGKGLISDAHPLAGGVLGRSGTPIASWFMNESDLLLVFGASFSNHTGITPKKETIQVDFDPMALGKFHAVDIPVWGEIGVVADLMIERACPEAQAIDHHAEVAERWAIWRKEKERREGDERGEGVSSAAIFAAMTRLVPENAVIAVDVGNNTYSFGRYFECKRQSVLMSGYLGSIGFGYPAAMGAWAAAGEKRSIFAVTGDGGFGQYLGELTTAVKYGMNIKHILLNNSELGKISKEQRAGEWEVWQTALHNPNFAEYAQICGGFGVRVTKKEQLDEALTNAMSYDGPAMVEILSDPLLV